MYERRFGDICSSVSRLVPRRTNKSCGCKIDGRCYAHGDHNPGNPCDVCDVVANPYGWSLNALGWRSKNPSARAVCSDGIGVSSYTADLYKAGAVEVMRKATHVFSYRAVFRLP